MVFGSVKGMNAYFILRAIECKMVFRIYFETPFFRDQLIINKKFLNPVLERYPKSDLGAIQKVNKIVPIVQRDLHAVNLSDI